MPDDPFGKVRQKNNANNLKMKMLILLSIQVFRFEHFSKAVSSCLYVCSSLLLTQAIFKSKRAGVLNGVVSLFKLLKYS